MEAIMSMLLEKSPGEALEVPCLADPGVTLSQLGNIFTFLRVLKSNKE